MSVNTDEKRDTGKKTAGAAPESETDETKAVDRDDVDTDDAAEAGDTPSPQTRSDDGDISDDDRRTAGKWRRRILWGALVAVFVVLVGAVGIMGWQLWQQRQVADAGEQARQAATEYAQTLTSIDSEKVDENFDAVLDGATGEFKDMYSQSSSQLRQLLIDNKASAHGVVLESAIQSATKDKAVILLFVDQSVSNTNVPDPRIDRSRIKMTMEYVDGRWRASKVELP